MKKLILFLVLPLMISCGPTQEEIDAMNAAKADNLRHTTIKTSDCSCSDYTVTYYDVDSCEYVGQLNNSNHDVFAHSGHCKRCEKHQIHLMDSIVKSNLKDFFAIKK